MKKFTFILALVMAVLPFTNAKADKLPIRLAESTISHYTFDGDWQVEKAIDNDYTTKFWSNDNPQAGYTFTVYLSSSANVGDIKLYFDNGDLPADGAVIEVDENNSGNWIQAGEPLNGVQANDVVTRNAGGVYTEKVRIRFTQASAYWFRLLEFEVFELEAAVPERTISAVATEGGTVTVNGGSDAVTSTGNVVLKAEPVLGYKFVNWTVDGNEVSTSAEYTDATEGDKEYVANFAKYESSDEWYALMEKPTFKKDGGTTIVASVQLNDNAAVDVEYVKGTTSRIAEPLTVEPGKDYTLTVKYEMHWGDLAVYQIDKNGAEKKYGYYTCVWEANGDPVSILERDNSALMCEEFGLNEFADFEVESVQVSEEETQKFITLPYQITIDENQQDGDLVVVRLMVGKKGDNNSAFETDIEEGGCFDVLLKVEAEDKEDGGDAELAIDEVNVEVENEVKEIYDLQGRRIDEITKPGIYVVNGSRVLVK